MSGATDPSRARWRAIGHAALRSSRALVAVAWLTTAAATSLAQPANPVAIAGEPLALTRSPRTFDGVAVDHVVLTAKSVTLSTDSLGAWTPMGAGTTGSGFVLRHRTYSAVFVTLSPFAGRGPGATNESWLSYRRSVAAQFGAEINQWDAGEPGTVGGTPSVASWDTREALFVSTTPDRAERHVVASDATRGVVIILAGPASEIEALKEVEGDFRFLLARLARQ